MDRKMVQNAVDALDAQIEDLESHWRHTEAMIIEARDRRSDLLQTLDPPKIIDYRQERWQFPR